MSHNIHYVNYELSKTLEREGLLKTKINGTKKLVYVAKLSQKGYKKGRYVAINGCNSAKTGGLVPGRFWRVVVELCPLGDEQGGGYV